MTSPVIRLLLPLSVHPVKITANESPGIPRNRDIFQYQCARERQEANVSQGHVCSKISPASLQAEWKQRLWGPLCYKSLDRPATLDRYWKPKNIQTLHSLRWE